MSSSSGEISFMTSLISGGIAGTSVDVALYPLDTIKTRLQSSQGFIKAGGFRGIYKGLSAAAGGAAPGAALFFSTYESVKNVTEKDSTLAEPVTHMIAACCGEVMACLIRVPTEVIKQKMQTGMHPTFRQTVAETLASGSGISGFYRGFGITIMREIPFSLIQFPLYEQMKKKIAQWRAGTSNISTLDQTTLVKSYEGAVCGSISGAIAAALTTPLDVIKTRVMLGSDSNGVAYKGIVDTAKRLAVEGSQSSKGSVGIFFSGVGPRVMWISIGGFVFFGAYEQSVRLLKYIS